MDATRQTEDKFPRSRTPRIMSSPEQRSKLNQAAIAYERLRELILSGAIKPGSQVLELEAAALLGMSRTPVREAMVRLDADGMVELRARHGMRVLPISADDMREIYEVLTSLEASAARIVAQRGVPAEQLDLLQRTVKRMDDALDNDDLDDWAKADELFHRTLVECCGNGRLLQIVDQFWAQSHRARLATLRLRPKPVESNREHAALIEAIKKGEGETAMHLHEQHRRRAGKLLVDLLDQIS